MYEWAIANLMQASLVGSPRDLMMSYRNMLKNVLRVVQQVIKSCSNREDLARLNSADLDAVLHAADTLEFASQALRRLEKALCKLPQFSKEKMS